MSDWLGSAIDLAGGFLQRNTNKNSAFQSQRFQEMMSNTSHQRETADLRAAGLNPILSGTGGMGASSAQAAQAAPASNILGDSYRTGMSSAKTSQEIQASKKAMEATDVQIGIGRATERKTNAEAESAEVKAMADQASVPYQASVAYNNAAKLTNEVNKLGSAMNLDYAQTDQVKKAIEFVGAQLLSEAERTKLLQANVREAGFSADIKGYQAYAAEIQNAIDQLPEAKKLEIARRLLSLPDIKSGSLAFAIQQVLTGKPGAITKSLDLGSAKAIENTKKAIQQPFQPPPNYAPVAP